MGIRACLPTAVSQACVTPFYGIPLGSFSCVIILCIEKLQQTFLFGFLKIM